MIQLKVLTLTKRLYSQIPVNFSWSMHDIDNSVVLGWIDRSGTGSTWNDHLIVEKNGVYASFPFSENVYGTKMCVEFHAKYPQIYIA